MRKIALMVFLGVYCGSCSSSQPASDESNKKGSYFGQKEPGLIPEVFAPGSVSINGRFEGSISFSSDLKEMFFEAEVSEKTNIYYSRWEANQWTPIEKLNFTENAEDEELHPFVRTDGQRVYFAANDSAAQIPKIWYVDRSGNSWSSAMRLDSPINDDVVFYPNLAGNGDMFYFNLSKFKTYRAPYQNGKFPKVQQVEIDLGHHGFISPDQDYLLVAARNQEDTTRKDNDIYVYFKQQDNLWSKPINLGENINTRFNEKSPSITPDGGYLFFGRDERDIEPGLANIYWVSTDVIDRLRPEQ